MLSHKSQNRISYLARFGYVGHHFHGLQPNKGVKTAGGALLEIVESAAGVRPKALQFSARTDAGVHALENYATFWFPKPFNHDQFLERLSNENLRDLRFVQVKLVPYNVHARANAKGKWYRYCIEDDSVAQHDLGSLAWRIVPRLNIQDMQKAASFLLGTHAFDAFRHGGCSANSTMKTLTSIKITQVTNKNQRQIFIDIRGTGFLRRMVRIIVGTLVEVGAGLRHCEDMKAILESKRRKNAGPSAPACGLTLMQIEFDNTQNQISSSSASLSDLATSSASF